MSDPNLSPVARSRAARAIVADVLAGALWTILRAESATETHVPPTRPTRLLQPVPTVSQLLEISGG